MARYIDADRFKNHLEKAMEKMHLIGGVKGVDICAVIKSLDMQPTADVVPKSEVDKDIKVLTKEVAKQKAMLLDAIDTFRNLLCIESFVDYEDTRKHYVVNLDDVDRIHAELKKKYTEGET